MAVSNKETHFDVIFAAVSKCGSTTHRRAKFLAAFKLTTFLLPQPISVKIFFILERRNIYLHLHVVVRCKARLGSNVQEKQASKFSPEYTAYTRRYSITIIGDNFKCTFN